MIMKKTATLIALVTCMVVGAIFATTASASDPTCVTGNCQTIPATPVSSTETSTTSSVTQIQGHIRSYERRTKTIVAIHMVPGGLSSAKGCVDPVKKGWIKPGQKFRNTRANGTPFWDRWQRGWMICGSKRIKSGKYFYMKGTKKNCGNADILIPLGKAKKVKRKIKKSIEISSYKEFEKLIKSDSTSTTTKTSYVCPAGWTQNGTTCRLCPPPTCECPYGYEWNGTICAKDGTIGPGEGTPGQPGGPGSGGEPGHPTEGSLCRNSAGDIVPGPADQFGYCTT